MSSCSRQNKESPAVVKPGDIVLKKGPLDTGQVGLVLEVTQNSIGYRFVKVMKDSGIIKTWYSDQVEVLNEN